MAPRVLGGNAAARSTIQKADLDQVGLGDLLERVRFLAQRRCDGVQPDGPAAVVLEDDPNQPAVQPVESEGIDAETFQARARDVAGDATVSANIREVTQAPE